MYSFYRYCCLILGLGLLTYTRTWAQNPGPLSTTMLPASFLPKSPTLASLQRFDMQQNVEPMTGAAQVSVPLVEITCGALQLPVSLGYSYTGLKVSQPLDLVGLGWSLQAGGSINRQVVGLLDETRTAYAPAYNSDSVLRREKDQLFLANAVKGFAEVAPDLYSFAVAGYSGRFVLHDTTAVLLPPQPLQVRVLHGGFQVAAETGVRYQFEAVEQTTPNHNLFGPIPRHASAWHLTRIISADNADTIRLHYSAWDYTEPTRRIAQTNGNYCAPNVSNALRAVSGLAYMI